MTSPESPETRFHGVPDNYHPDLKKTALLLIERYLEDDPDFVTKPRLWKEFAIERIHRGWLQSLESLVDTEFSEYDAPVWREDIIDAAMDVK